MSTTLALVIGVSSYRDKNVAPLPAAQIDAVHFARALFHWGVEEENITLFLNGEANKDAIEKCFASISKIEKKYKFIFYFCGHGFRNGSEIPKSQLLLHDGSSCDLDSLLDEIGTLKALESYVLIDACYLRINSLLNPKLSEEIRGEKVSRKSLFCLLSSGIEESFENDQYGYFTDAFLKSLSKLRTTQCSPTQLVADICHQLRQEGLPLPEMYNIGNQKISFASTEQGVPAKIQDTLIQNRGKIACLVDKKGVVKSAVWQKLVAEKFKIFSVAWTDPFAALDGLPHDSLIIIEQAEKLNPEQLDYLCDQFLVHRIQILLIAKRPLRDRVEGGHQTRWVDFSIEQKSSLFRKYFNKILLTTCLLLTLLTSYALFYSFGVSIHPHVSGLKPLHPDFVGRKEYLLKLKELSFRSASTPSVAILWGEGGVGKSEIAVTFANRQIKKFPFICWIDCGTEESYSASYRALAEGLNISILQREPLLEIVRKVHRFLENERSLQPWLLIFDNAETRMELPQKGNGAVLVTTRNRLPWHTFPCLEVLPFKKEEAIALFRRITQKSNSTPGSSLIEELDFFPLTLNLAAHYIAETPGMSEELYLHLLSQNNLEMIANMPSDIRYSTPLLASWKITAGELFEKHPEVLQWLHFCSYLCPEGIPSSWIDTWLIECKKKDNSLLVQLQKHEIMRILVNQSFMRFEKNTLKLSLHRLKQEAIKKDPHFDLKTADEVLEFLIRKGRGLERITENHPNWESLREWESHAAWFLANKTHLCSKEWVAELQNLLGNWKCMKGEFKNAELLHKESINARIALFGEEDRRTIISQNNLAWLFWEIGQFQEAHDLFTSALKNSQQVYGYDHMDTITTMNNLGWVLWEMGKFEEAKILLRSSLKKSESRHDFVQDIDRLLEFIETEKDKKENVSKQALLLRYAGLWIEEVEGNVQKALKYFQESLQIFKKILGIDDPKTAIAFRSVGISLNRIGRYEEALGFIQKALEIQQKIFGEEHPECAKSYSNLGVSFVNLGRYQEALECNQKALEIRLKIFGIDHSETAKSFSGIGTTLASLNQYEEALVHNMKALEIRKKIFGEEHLETAKSYSSLGINLGGLGQHQEALECNQKALEIMKKNLGENHLLTARAYALVGTCFRKLGLLQEAAGCEHKAEAIRNVLSE